MDAGPALSNADDDRHARLLGRALNAGSKVVIAAVGPRRFELATELPGDLRLPEGFENPRVVLPGVLAVEGPRCVR